MALPIPKATGSSSTNCGFDLLGCVKLSSQMVVEKFRYDFERSAEQAGLMHVVTDSASPWQNGRAERHGGWIKHKKEEELQSGQSVVTTEEDLDLLVLSLVANKNRYFDRGGYSPYQLTLNFSQAIHFKNLGDLTSMQTLLSRTRLRLSSTGRSGFETKPDSFA